MTRVLVVLLLTLGGVAPLEAQGTGSSRLSGFRVELGVVASTPLVEDGNGVSVRRGVGPAAAGDVSWRLSEQAMFVATLRGSIAPLRLRSMERRWSPASTRQLDFTLRVEEEFAGSVVAGAGLMAALMFGPDDIIPFRSGEGTVFGWGPEVTVARPLSRQRRLDIVVAGDAVRISPPEGETPVVGGWIGRLRLGIRHAL